uniref:MARVEL domain-containing protein n=1 Tax=Elaeophora elaphi TaxID=1147741 RepID=A0A0R3S4M8_9BILA
LQHLQLFAYLTTTIVTQPLPPPIPPPTPSPLLLSSSYYHHCYHPILTSMMYSNPTCVRSNATSTTPSVPTVFPDYSAYLPYSINPINDRVVMNSYYGSVHPSQSTAYRSYLQVDISPTFNRRSRTVPTRAVPPKIYKMMFAKRNRGYAVDPYFFDPREYRSYSGPWKDARRWPMYRKKKESSGRIQTYQESEFGGNAIDRQPRYCQGLYRGTFHTPFKINGELLSCVCEKRKVKLFKVQLDMQPSALRRIRPYYAPSYATYPPSIMNAVRTKEKCGQRYSIMMRITVKAIELLLGACTVGLIIAPMREMSIYAFVQMTQTEWQGLVLGICASFSALCFIMLFGACFGYRCILWRRFDYLISLIGSLGHLLVGAIEVYYAVCYPPNGEKIGSVCYRLEWIVASALIFINVVMYIMDSVLSFRTGISML